MHTKTCTSTGVRTLQQGTGTFPSPQFFSLQPEFNEASAVYLGLGVHTKQLQCDTYTLLWPRFQPSLFQAYISDK